MINNKISKKSLSSANRKLKALLLKTIKTKRGGKANAPLKRRTGKLQDNIKPLLTIKGETLQLDVEVMEYYQYLDEGTKRITNPWFLTEDFTGSKEFRNIIKDLLAEGLKGAAFDIISTIKK